MRILLPIILAGGSGSRLWPLSREDYPKQLLALTGQRSLLQETLLRAQKAPRSQPPIVICNKQYRFLIQEQMQDLGIAEPQLILEPVGRNTAPAIAIAAHLAQSLYPDQNPILLVLPADHLIKDTEIFIERLHTLLPFVDQGHLATFGIMPTAPETGYGYIKAGKMQGQSVYQIEKFIEKPPLEKAETYLKEGHYYWNSGMFLFKADTYLKELQKHAPSIATCCENEAKKLNKIGNFYLLSENFSECPDQSIDYALMEKTDKALVTPLPIQWNDVGSWSALWDMIPADKDGNVIQGDVITLDTQNCYIRSESRLVAIAGLKDHIVVETPDAVMVAHKDYAQKVKDLFHSLKAKSRTEALHHTFVQRPWGSYKVLVEAPHYRVKQVSIKPGASLSKQMHKHRSEHWTILKGSAKLQFDHQIQSIKAHESAFIPAQEWHQLSNASQKEILEIIEIQMGDYLSEEDIHYMEDHEDGRD